MRFWNNIRPGPGKVLVCLTDESMVLLAALRARQEHGARKEPLITAWVAALGSRARLDLAENDCVVMGAHAGFALSGWYRVVSLDDIMGEVEDEAAVDLRAQLSA